MGSSCLGRHSCSSQAERKWRKRPTLWKSQAWCSNVAGGAAERPDVSSMSELVSYQECAVHLWKHLGCSALHALIVGETRRARVRNLHQRQRQLFSCFSRCSDEVCMDCCAQGSTIMKKK